MTQYINWPVACSLRMHNSITIGSESYWKVLVGTRNWVAKRRGDQSTYLGFLEPQYEEETWMDFRALSEDGKIQRFQVDIMSSLDICSMKVRVRGPRIALHKNLSERRAALHWSSSTLTSFGLDCPSDDVESKVGNMRL